MKSKKKDHIPMSQLVDNAKKVLKGRLLNTNKSTYETDLKRVAQVKQHGSK